MCIRIDMQTHIAALPIVTLGLGIWPADLNACRGPAMDYISTDLLVVVVQAVLLPEHGQTQLQKRG